LLALIASTGCDDVFDIDHIYARDAAGARDDGADRPGADGGATDGPIAPADAAIMCPSSYSLVIAATTTHYRRITTTTTTWQLAEGMCEADSNQVDAHTHLAVVTSTGELSALHTKIGSTEVWLGLSDLATDGTFHWVTNEPTTYPPASGSPWQNGAPQGGSTQHCVKMVGTGEITNVDCTNQPQILCECDAYAPL
jgi:hypothetical protein